MNTAAYTANSGLLDQACMSSTTWSVIRLTVSLATEAPYTSAKWALISPVVNPFAYNDSTTRSTSLSRRCRLPTITGAKVPVPVPRNLDLHLPGGVGQHRLGAGAVAGVAIVAALDGVLVVAEVLAGLLLQ